MSDDKRHELFDYVSRAGPMYGVEDFAFFLYSLVRMHKPLLVLELGSGSGSCSLMCSLAMHENGAGKVMSFDNGAQWDRIRGHKALSFLDIDSSVSHHAFLRGLAEKFGTSDHVDYIEQTFPPYPEPAEKIDMIFSDYESSPAVIAALFAHFLPRMSESCSIFIDSASTGQRSFFFLELFISYLNASKLPAFLSKLLPDESLPFWIHLLHTRRFTLMHVVEKKDRDQNSTTWIKVDPIDSVPYPATKMR